MAGAEQLGNRQARNRASAVPVFDQAGTEDLLPHSLHNEALGIGCPGKRRGFPLKPVEQFVWEGSGQLKGTPNETVEGRNVGNTQGAFGAGGE